MASDTLVIPTSYHKPTPSVRKSRIETTKVRSEDELLKFFLHGSYDVQRGHLHTCQDEAINDKALCIKDEITTTSTSNTEDTKAKSRCMFEETYMINISVKQPNTAPSSKQIDVRIEKTPSDTQITNEKIDDDDEISSIFDEEENDEVDSVIFNEINSAPSETQSTKLTLADMINKTLTTIPPTVVTSSPSSSISDDQKPKVNANNTNWFMEQQGEIETKKSNDHVPPSKSTEKIITSSPLTPMSTIIQTPTLTMNISEDEKLFEYLDYLETKEESNQSSQTPIIPTVTKPTKPTAPSVNKEPLKQNQSEPIPIIDLEQLCRSLTVQDLKDELIRKKINELKALIEERHRKLKSQIPLVKPRKDTLPVLIAMPPAAAQQRRRPNVTQSALLQSKTVNLQVPYNSPFNDIYSTFNNKFSPISSSSTTTSSSNHHQQQFSRHQAPLTKYKL